MRLPTLRPWPPVLPAGEDAYQEFVAGTIAVTRVVTDEEDLVLDEHDHLVALRHDPCDGDRSGNELLEDVLARRQNRWPGSRGRQSHVSSDR